MQTSQEALMSIALKAVLGNIVIWIVAAMVLYALDSKLANAIAIGFGMVGGFRLSPRRG